MTKPSLLNCRISRNQIASVHLCYYFLRCYVFHLFAGILKELVRIFSRVRVVLELCSLTANDPEATPEMEPLVATPHSATTTIRSENPEAAEGGFSEGSLPIVVNTTSVTPETPLDATPLAALIVTVPNIADYSPLKWKKSKKIYHTLIAASFALVV